MAILRDTVSKNLPGASFLFNDSEVKSVDETVSTSNESEDCQSDLFRCEKGNDGEYGESSLNETDEGDLGSTSDRDNSSSSETVRSVTKSAKNFL